jgi:hypothetical protein
MGSRRTGVADLKLHPGRAPSWLVTRMQKLSEKIFTIIHDEFGEEEILARLSNPLFFQACSNVLGYDWDSSGSTTVTCAVLKNAFDSTDVGVRAIGGKGRRSRLAPEEIDSIVEEYDLSEEETPKLAYASKITAKVDSVAVQAGYQLYHHMMFISRGGRWAVIQQGMRTDDRVARRYHWLSSKVKSFVDKPHSGIVGELAHDAVLDMTAMESEKCRNLCVDLVTEGPERIQKWFRSIRRDNQETLTRWMGASAPKFAPNYWSVPRRVDWDALKAAQDIRPENYEQLLAIRGIGPATARGLALVSEIIFGTPASWKDPVRFSFAYGGKDGIPFPVDRKAMDESVEILDAAVENARIGDTERLRALERLREFSSRVPTA